jgi:hypothetical protein
MRSAMSCALWLSGLCGEVVEDGGVEDLLDEVEIGVLGELSLVAGLFEDGSYARPVVLAVAACQ